jgi:hypothetical protein
MFGNATTNIDPETGVPTFPGPGTGPGTGTGTGPIEVIVVEIIPDINVNIPDVHVDINVQVDIPDVVVNIPDVVVNIPDVTVNIPDVNVDVTLDFPDMTEGSINWHRLQDIAVFDKFPFSIPKDLHDFVDAIAAPPLEPSFEFQLIPTRFTSNSVQGRSGIPPGTIVLDFSQFEEIRQLVRDGFLIFFIIGLIAATKNYIWTGGG